MADFLDEPLADASIVPTYLLSRFTRQHVTVALGGDGGDELFAGYPTFKAHLPGKLFFERLPAGGPRAGGPRRRRAARRHRLLQPGLQAEPVPARRPRPRARAATSAGCASFLPEELADVLTPDLAAAGRRSPGRRRRPRRPQPRPPRADR